MVGVGDGGWGGVNMWRGWLCCKKNKSCETDCSIDPAVLSRSEVQNFGFGPFVPAPNFHPMSRALFASSAACLHAAQLCIASPSYVWHFLKRVCNLPLCPLPIISLSLLTQGLDCGIEVEKPTRAACRVPGFRVSVVPG